MKDVSSAGDWWQNHNGGMRKNGKTCWRYCRICWTSYSPFSTIAILLENCVIVNLKPLALVPTVLTIFKHLFAPCSFIFFILEVQMEGITVLIILNNEYYVYSICVWKLITCLINWFFSVFQDLKAVVLLHILNFSICIVYADPKSRFRQTVCSANTLSEPLLRLWLCMCELTAVHFCSILTWKIIKEELVTSCLFIFIVVSNKTTLTLKYFGIIKSTELRSITLSQHQTFGARQHPQWIKG